MVERFDDLGIAAELAAGAERLGWEAPTALQEAAIPVIRRGNNVVLHASTGAGVTGAYGLGVLDRLAAEPEADPNATRALILMSDAHAASRAADRLALLASFVDLGVRAAASGWPERATPVLAISAADAVAALQTSALKLDAVVALVVVGADRLIALGEAAALETVLEAVPAAAQRVIVTGRFDPRTDDLIERHARRAMTIPPRPAEGAAGEEPADTGVVVRYVVASETEKPAAAAHLLATGDISLETAVLCRTVDRAEHTAEALAARGIGVQGQTGAGEDARVLVLPRLEADQRSTRARVISYDVPFDAESLMELHGRGGEILVTPRELPHLRRLAARAGIKLESVRLPEARGLNASDALRERLRAAARDADLAADLALIEPLLDEFPAAEVAAAATYLARAAAAARPGAPARGGTHVPATAPAGRPGAGAPPPSTSWARLFVSAGSRDGVGPGDLVGAIAGDAGIPGDQVGKIEVKESYSTVEVPTGLAATVIAAMNGRTLRGRSLRVDYDRKTRPQGRGPVRRSPGGRGRSPRRGADGENRR